MTALAKIVHTTPEIEAEPDLTDGFHLVIDVIDRVPGLASKQALLRQFMMDQRLRCRRHTRLYGEDAPDVADWVWPG